MNWYIQVLKKYAVFSGRARRKEYWMFFLFNIIFAAIASILDGIIGTRGESGIGVIHAIYSLFVLIPGLAVTVRRLHDTDRSGWWIFIVLIPVICAIWLLVLMIIDGTPGGNKYGPNPKETSEIPAQPVMEGGA
jgi:uncharacterized membrane protein YhaH (DUF805 family)